MTPWALLSALRQIDELRRLTSPDKAVSLRLKLDVRLVNNVHYGAVHLPLAEVLLKQLLVNEHTGVPV